MQIDRQRREGAQEQQPTSGAATSAQEGARQAAAVVRCSRIELIRALAADLIEKMNAADETQRLLLFMQLRNVQDCISAMKHSNALVAAKSSRLAWVDAWTPVDTTT